MNPVSISYCTTCKGRLHQLRETLPVNLATLQADEEIVLVDFNSPDGLAAWVRDNFSDAIERGALRFFEVLDEAPWHTPKAKNIAHRLGRGDYLFNLDADNFLLPQDAQRIRAARQQRLGCRQGTGDLRDGTPGRIGIERDAFYAIGGYDQGLLRALIDDFDLIVRAEAAGYQFARLGAPERLPLQHGRIERLGETAAAVPLDDGDHDRIGQINRTLSTLRLQIDGPRRLQNFATYRGRLNGAEVVVDGLGNVHPAVSRPDATSENRVNPVSISYCTTCKGRLYQLRETLAGNLATLRADEEIVLVDFNSPDGLAAWVWDHFGDAIERGALRFFEVLDEAPWHSPKAKNLAHRLARGNFLFNLDGDNFLLPEDADKIRAAAAAGSACRQGSGDLRDGTPGRIGVPRAIFLELGGYDEGLLGTLVQDVDLIVRTEALRQRFVRLGAPARLPVQNDVVEKLASYPRGTADPADPADDLKRIGQANLALARLRTEFDGPRRLQNFATYRGRLNGAEVIFDGLGNFHPAI